MKKVVMSLMTFAWLLALPDGKPLSTIETQKRPRNRSGLGELHTHLPRRHEKAPRQVGLLL